MFSSFFASRAIPRLPAIPSILSIFILALMPAVGVANSDRTLYFEPNQGQFADFVQFFGKARGYQVTVQDSVITFGTASTSADAFSMRLKGGAAAANFVAEDRLPGRSNYFLGSDPQQWRRDIPHFGRLRASEVYPGIDIVLYGRERQFEFDFEVAPGRDPSLITMQLTGSEAIRLDNSGSLVLTTGGAPLIIKPPIAYQQSPQGRVSVAANFLLGDDGAVRFEIGAYDRDLPLVIDPMVVLWSTYLGGSSSVSQVSVDEAVQNIDSGPDGSVYLTGFTFSSNFPLNGSTQGYGGGADAFVSRISADGQTLIYSTFIGGGGDDNGFDIRVDASGNAYVTGETASPAFPATPGAFQEDCGTDMLCNGDRDGFVLKLNAAGNALVYATFIGGSGFDKGVGIDIDGSGNAYVAGLAGSADFPTTAGAFLDADPDSVSASNDAFVSKLNATGSALLYSTYLGAGFDNGSGEDSQATGIAVDGAGNAYVVGLTSRISPNNFPTTSGAFYESAPLDFKNAFLSKLNAAGSDLVYSTFIGGDDDDGANGVILIGDNAIVVGETSSSDFPVVQALQSSGGGAIDGFAMSFNSSGSGLNFSTYLGGEFNDRINDVAYGGDSLCLGGTTASGDFPVHEAFQDSPGGVSGNDAFAASISPNGNRFFYSTYFGGSDHDLGTAVDCNGSLSVVIAGSTESSTDFPLNQPLQGNFGGGETDGFVARLVLDGENIPANSRWAVWLLVLLTLGAGLWFRRLV